MCEVKLWSNEVAKLQMEIIFGLLSPGGIRLSRTSREIDDRNERCELNVRDADYTPPVDFVTGQRFGVSHGVSAEHID